MLKAEREHTYGAQTGAKANSRRWRQGGGKWGRSVGWLALEACSTIFNAFKNTRLFRVPLCATPHRPTARFNVNHLLKFCYSHLAATATTLIVVLMLLLSWVYLWSAPSTSVSTTSLLGKQARTRHTLCQQGSRSTTSFVEPSNTSSATTLFLRLLCQ